MKVNRRFYRVEKIQDAPSFLVIDELDNFFGEVSMANFFNFCSGTVEEVRDFDGYTYWYCDVDELNYYKK